VAIPGSYVPVDVSDIVTELVFANFTEGHTAPFKRAVVFSCEDIPGKPFRFYLNFPNFF
jgi:hypothetical protein